MKTDGRSAPATEAQTSTRQPKWHLLYYVLAAFDLLTVIASLTLSHQITRIYSESVRENQTWADRLGRYAAIGEAAGRVNAPGNDVFDSRDVPRERDRMLTTRGEFDQLLDAARQDLLNDPSIEKKTEFLHAVADISAAMTNMQAEAEQIFSHLSSGEDAKAGSRMAAMDRRYADVNAAIAVLQRHSRELQHELFTAQIAQTNGLRKFEYTLAGLILLMIVAVTVYGHKIAASVRAADELRRRTALERERLQQQLVDASRQAGMAEVATGVLHNVGNVLNSVNVSVEVVRRTVEDLRAPQLQMATQLMTSRRDELGRFLTEDAKGRQLPDYLEMLSEALVQDHKTLLAELEHLGSGLEHVKQVISSQQRMAKNSTLVQPVAPGLLFHEALRLALGATGYEEIEISREFANVGELMLDKHRILQILVNLITNARKALHNSPPGARTITLRVAASDDRQRVRFEVQDSGVGMSAEQLAAVFGHGFTTRPDGHGFGLHSAANAAMEMGGTLTACSDGLGKGACFTLQLPMNPATVAA